MTEELLKAMDVEGVGAFDVIGDVSTTLANLTTRLNLYMGDATRLGRWQAELLVEDVADDLARRAEAGRVLTNLDRVTSSAETVARTLELENASVLLDRPRDLVREERQALLADVDRQRVESLEYLTGEREAAVAALLEGVRAERVATLAQIRQERLETLVEIERLRRDTIADTAREGSRLVDQLVWRLAQLLAGLLLLAALLAWLTLWTARRGGHA
jgi:hypothetical protein